MERTRKGNPVVVTAEVLEGLEAVRLCGKTNMLDHVRVIELAFEMGHVDTALWVYDNRREFATGIFAGFQAHHIADGTAPGGDS